MRVTSNGWQNSERGQEQEQAAEHDENDELDPDLRIVQLDSGGPWRCERETADEREQQAVVHQARGAEPARRGFGRPCAERDGESDDVQQNNYVA